MKKLLITLISALTILAVTLTVIAGSILASRKKTEHPPEVPAATESIQTVPTTEAPPSETEPPAAEATAAPTVTPIVTEAPETVPETTAPKVILYATTRANVRKGPGVKYDQIGKLEKGSFVEQVSESKDKWTEIWFQGQKAFVASEYLTQDKPQYHEPAPTEPMPGVREIKDTVYSTGSLHVRSGPGKNYKSIGYLKEGQEAQRVGIADNGWSKIRYNSGFGYVSNQYLKTEKAPSEDLSYKDVNETVYATDNLNLRSGPSLHHKISAKLKAGESIRRIGIGSNGWSEVLYEGSRLYASSKYLTDKNPNGEDSEEETKAPAETRPAEPAKPRPACREVDETLVASQDLVLYSGPDASYQELGHLTKGSLIHRTGVCDNGWSRILLGGKNVYVVSGYLTEEKKPEPQKPKPTEPAEPSGPVRDKDGFIINEKTVYTAGEDVNVRSAPNTSSEKLGKLSKGTSLKQLSVGDIGWTKVRFQSKDAYIKSSLLTEEAPPVENAGKKEVFGEVNETIYSIDDVIVRAGPDSDSEALGHLYFGDSARRIGIGEKGWSQILWEGRTAYVYSKYISTEKPEIPDFGDTTTPDFPTPNSPFIYQYLDMEGLIPHAVFLPADDDGSHPLPLIISLHGSAEVGQSREFMEQQHLTKVFREWEYTKLQPIQAIVVCPHIGKDVPFKTWGTPEGADAIFKLIENLKENYEIDEDRIILEGHSMGGQGALYIAADDRAAFQKLAVVSAYYGEGTDYSKIKIPVYGCSGGGRDRPETEQDSPGIYKFMNTTFKNAFPDAPLYVGPYNHDNVAIRFFQKDEDKDGQSDIIQWMLK